MRYPEPRRTRVSRADLVAGWGLAGADGVAAVAEMIGLHRPVVREPVPATLPESVPRAPVAEPEPEPTLRDERPKARFWHQLSRVAREPAEQQRRVPDWFARQKDQVGEEDVRAEPARRAPRQLPLVPWSRLWPCLRLLLGERRGGNQPDPERAVAHLASGKPFDRLPRLVRRRWAANAVILVDRGPHLQPYAADFRNLIASLIPFRGRDGLRVLAVEEGPERPFRDWFDPTRPARPFRMPRAGTPVLVLGDLGCLTEDAAMRSAWLRFGRRLRRHGAEPMALMPGTPVHDGSGSARVWTRVLWDRGRPMRPVIGRLRRAETDPGRLLALLAAAVRIEPALLRAIRLCLPVAGGGAELEALVWQDPAVRASPIGCMVDPEALSAARTRFREEKPALQDRVVALIAGHHGGLSEAIQEEERLLGCVLRGRPIPDVSPLIAAVVRTLKEKGRLEPQLRAWLGRRIPSLDPAMWQHQGWAAARQLALPDAPLPEGFDPGLVQWVTTDPEAEMRTWTLVQKGPRLVAEPGHWRPGDDPHEAGSPIAVIGGRGSALFIDGEGVPASGSLVLSDRSEHIAIDSGDERVVLGKSGCPAGMRGIGRDGEGLFVETSEGRRITWPTWADRLGLDEFGVYAEFGIGSVKQTMRLIQPGTFLMGSPETEDGRFDDETQHEVTLTRAFWLADTACSQALWTSVVGENPSHFSDDPECPVETVSWEDVATFFRRLEHRYPDLALRLPTEAEWEYACRAGTTGAFWFGDRISTDYVNYGNKVERTSPVRALPANPWGLFHMHGNVWEWCGDWSAPYSGHAAKDPVGPSTGAYRVVRGGSWFSVARNARAADRLAVHPSYRSHDLGCRFARGQDIGEHLEESSGRGHAPDSRNGVEAVERGSPDASPGIIDRLFRRKKR